MLKRNQVTAATCNTLILGIHEKVGKTAITGVIRLLDGGLEDVIELVDTGSVWQVLNHALAELHIIKATQLMLLTTSDSVFRWLQRPHAEQTEQRKVRVGRDIFMANVGGDPEQWRLLRHLFRYVWRCEKVETLPKAESLWTAN